MKKLSSGILLTFIFLFSSQLTAAYCATDVIRGNVCSGFIIESCSFVQIDAIENDDGEMFDLAKCYEDVSDFSDSNGGRCWIQVKSTGWGLISDAINFASQPAFYRRNEDGQYIEAGDVEYLTFACRRT